MPIPKPNADENEADFHARCMSAIWNEYKNEKNGEAQANAICYSTWRDHHKSIDTGTGLVAYDLQGQRKKANMNGGPKRLYGRIEKVEDIGDGTIKVHGIVSTEDEDDQGEIVRASAMRSAIPDYMRFGAVREMHGLSAAGRALECNCGNDNITRIVTHVVDPTAVLKVKNKVYNGFSIGGRVDEREAGNNKAISKLTLHEISLVDRPANPQATIDLWKSGDKGMSDDGLNTMADAFAEALAKTQQFWRCNNAKHMHNRKEDAAKCMAKSAATDALKGRERMSDDDRRFGDGDSSKVGMPSGPTIEPDGSLKYGFPNTPQIKPGEPPGASNSESNFDGDGDSDDMGEESSESAGGSFKPEDDDDRADDFGKKAKPKGDYGKVRYADPGYQDDKKPRYPIDSEDHVRAAWSYINMPKNAKLYSSEQLGRVKAAIRSAAKKYGIEISEKAIFDLGNPEALIKALAFASIDELLDELPYDSSMVIEKAGRRQSGADHFLKNVVHDAIGKLTDGQFCMKASGNAMQDTARNTEHAAPNPGTDSGTAHYSGENAAQNTSKSDGADSGTTHYSGENAAQDTYKRGARHSAMTMKYLKKAHDNMCEAGASCPGRDSVSKTLTAEESAMSANPTTTSDDGSDATLALAKALKKRNKKLEKAMGTMSQQMQEMQLRMQFMAKESGREPPPPQPPVIIPEKEPKLKKTIGSMVETMAAMNKRIEQIANTPIPGAASRLPDGILEISKAQDGGQGAPPAQQMAAAEEVAKMWESMSEEQRFKASLGVSWKRPYTQQRY